MDSRFNPVENDSVCYVSANMQPLSTQDQKRRPRKKSRHTNILNIHEYYVEFLWYKRLSAP